MDFGIQQRGDQGHLRGGVGMGEAPAECAALADGVMADGSGGGGEEGAGGSHLFVRGDAMMAGQAADLDGARQRPHEIEFQQVVEVDQMVRPGEPHIEHGAEALAARN